MTEVAPVGAIRGLSVTHSGTGTGAAPADASPPTPAPKGPAEKKGVNVSESRTYLLKLTASVEVSVELTGMTIDFDCKVAGNRCTNWGGTRDDSWSGTLDKGEHKIVVYPYATGPGNYTLTVSAKTTDTGGSTGTVTKTTTLVNVSKTGVSSQQTYGFELDLNAEVDVALTGMTIDFDCKVGLSRCSNHGSTRNDWWKGRLDAGSHTVTVYPYATGPGNYSLTVTGTSTLTRVATPVGAGPGAMLCEKDENGQTVEGSCVLFETVVTKAPRPPLLPPPPPPPAPPPPTPPPPPPTGAGTPASTLPGAGNPRGRDRLPRLEHRRWGPLWGNEDAARWQHLPSQRHRCPDEWAERLPRARRRHCDATVFPESGGRLRRSLCAAHAGRWELLRLLPRVEPARSPDHGQSRGGGDRRP